MYYHTDIHHTVIFMVFITSLLMSSVFYRSGCWKQPCQCESIMVCFPQSSDIFHFIQFLMDLPCIDFKGYHTELLLLQSCQSWYIVISDFDIRQFQLYRGFDEMCRYITEEAVTVKLPGSQVMNLEALHTFYPRDQNDLTLRWYGHCEFLLNIRTCAISVFVA